jgi:hypothetical protein
LRAAKAESVLKGFGTDPLNLLQIMLAKGLLAEDHRAPRNLFESHWIG